MVGVTAHLGEVEVVIDVLEDLAGDVFLGEVHRFVADVVHVVLDRIPLVEGEHDRAGHVADVDEGALEAPFVDDQVAILDRLVGEVVGHEVEPHAVRHAERGGVAIGHAVAGVENHLLGGCLGFAVEGDRRGGGVFVADVVGDRPIDAAGGGENHLLIGLAQGQEIAGSLDVGVLGDLRFLLARGIADDGREVNDRVDVVENLAEGVGVGHVSLDQFEVTALAAREQPSAAELEAVEDADLVPMFQEQWDKCRSHVTRAAGDKNSH